jgi:hypothetical protein
MEEEEEQVEDEQECDSRNFSLTSSEELAFVRAFSTKAQLGDRDHDSESDDDNGSQCQQGGGGEEEEEEDQGDGDDGSEDNQQESAVPAADQSAAAVAAVHHSSYQSVEVSPESSEHEEEDRSGEEGRGDGHGFGESDAEEGHQSAENDGGNDEDEHEIGDNEEDEGSNVSGSEEHTPQPTVQRVPHHEDGDSIFGSQHSSDDLDFSDNDDLSIHSEGNDFAQFTARATEWAQAVRGHNVAAVLYDCVVGDEKSDSESSDN